VAITAGCLAGMSATMHSVRRVPDGVLVFSSRLGGDVGWFTTDSTWPQIADMMIPLHPILTTGKTEPPVTALPDDGLLRSNVDCDSIQPSFLTMPIGHFHELALP
jgi:hypothetical protein